MDSKQEDITQPIGKQPPQEEPIQSATSNVEKEPEEPGADENVSPLLERVREKIINPPEFNPENITEQHVEEGEEAQTGVDEPSHSMLDTIRETYTHKTHDLWEGAAGVKESVEHTISESFHRLSETAANVEDYIMETLTGEEQVAEEPVEKPEVQKEDQGILGTIRHWITPGSAETPETLDKPADYGKSDAEIAKESTKEEASSLKDTVMEKERGVGSAEETGSQASDKPYLGTDESSEKEHDKGLKESTGEAGPGVTEAWRELKDASKQPGLDISGERQDDKGLLKALHDWVVTPKEESKEFEPTEIEEGETSGKRELGRGPELYGELTSESLHAGRTPRDE